MVTWGCQVYWLHSCSVWDTRGVQGLCGYKGVPIQDHIGIVLRQFQVVEAFRAFVVSVFVAGVFAVYLQPLLPTS